MTSKERVIAAITFSGPDQVPVDVWPAPAPFEPDRDGLWCGLKRRGGAADESSGRRQRRLRGG